MSRMTESTEVSAAAPGALSAAPYALVRTAALPAPGPSPAAAAYRVGVERLVELTRWCEQVRPELCDTLHDLAASAPGPVRERVLVPLRRDVHNRRSPRPALRVALADAALEMPLLARWLSACDESDRLGARIDTLADPALAADRRALAELCRSRELSRAVALTSEDLLRAVRRAGASGDAPNKQARKSEPTVLRFAMRAVTKTSPLSWFADVGWGRWREGAEGPAARLGTPTAITRVEHFALEALVRAALEHPRSRATSAHRLAPGLRSDGSQVLYRRRPVTAAAPPRPAREEQVAVPLTGPLRHVLARVGAGKAVRVPELAAGIAARLPGPPERAERAALGYLEELVDQGLLLADYPFDPQASDAVQAAGRLLVDLGFVEAAAILAEIAADTQAYAGLAAGARPAHLDRLRSRWSRAFALVGAAPVGRRAPLTEDVVLDTVVDLDVRHGRAALPDLVRLTPLFEVFDGYSVVRRVVRDRFVARFGVGGRCASLYEFADTFAEAWQALDDVDPAGPGHDGDGGRPVGPRVEELLGLRAELAAGVPDADANGEVVLPERLVADAARRRPNWLEPRPTSYGVFVQPVPDGGRTRLCVNHVYGGWGRFTSRFLDHLDPSAREQVSARIGELLGAAERVAQVRPVGGFNANLHPRLVADEVSEIGAPGALGALRPEELELVHDPVGDGLRLRVAATGEPINVLYLGFLMPFGLPRRWLPLVGDLGSGVVDLAGALVPTRYRDTTVGRVGYRPRVRYRDIVLSRARWRLPAETAQAWRTESQQGSPVRAAARRRAHLGIPEQVFVAAAPPEAGGGPGSLPGFADRPRSQFVDLGSALHLRCLARTLARYSGGLILEEALPRPEAGARTVEFVAETYRSHL
ncbi:lantibiotic dehydratase [Embleya sp. AB8]|uniref:lantibiotic dehydratase n=1 Tax=Embleya sp. AB8 TaxID=3156304 RepID=UPI003C720627